MDDISQGQALQTARSVGGFQMPSGSVALTPLQLVALIKLGRNAGLEEAIAEASHWQTLSSSHKCGFYIAAAIESLKDNTP